MGARCGLPLFLLIALAAAPPSARAQAEAPSAPPAVADASITIGARAAALGVGFVWGAGTVDYKGQRYPVRVDGIGIGAAGALSVTARGAVYDLQHIDDLNGQYTALGAGLELGSGVNRMRMRNAKGVVIELTAEGRGAQVGIGPRGITLQVGAPDGPPAYAGFVLPRTLGFGQAAFGPLALQPTLNAQLAAFAAANAGFDGEWAAGPLDDSDVSLQHSNEVGLNVLMDLKRYGTLHGRVSGIFSLSSGLDPGATSYPDSSADAYSLEAAFAGWKSGDALPGLGYNAIEVAYGNQNYQVFDGLLFWDGGVDCGKRGACWLSPRNAFREAGTFRLTLGDWLIEGYHLKLNDDPGTGTRVGGGRIEYGFEDWFVRAMNSGFMYFNVYESDEPSRDGLNGFYFYQDGTPVPALPDFQYMMSFVAETNSAAVGNAEACGWYVAPAYTVSTLPWSPQISYRFASFSGGGKRNFDPLFTGTSDWGYWAQGEVLGEWVLPNSNVRSHMVRLKLEPNDVVTFNLFYYKFLLDDRDQDLGAVSARVGSRELADEVDAILDIAAANWWSMTVVLSVAVPNDGFRQATGGNATWFNSMLYTNFNF